MGEMVGDQLPTMVRFRETVTDSLTHAFALERVTIQPAASVAAHFAGSNASVIMNGLTFANGGVLTNMCCLVVPHTFGMGALLHGFQNPLEAYTMGISLVATLANNVEKERAMPFVDWLRASTQRLGQGPQERNASVLDQILDAAMPTPRVFHWMKGRLAACRLAVPVHLGGPNLAGGVVPGSPGPGQPPYSQPATNQST